MKPRFISKAPWAQTSKLAHIPRSLPTGRRVPCGLDTRVLFTDESLTRCRGGQGIPGLEGRKRTAKKRKGSARNGTYQCAAQRPTQPRDDPSSDSHVRAASCLLSGAMARLTCFVSVLCLHPCSFHRSETTQERVPIVQIISPRPTTEAVTEPANGNADVVRIPSRTRPPPAKSALRKNTSRKRPVIDVDVDVDDEAADRQVKKQKPNAREAEVDAATPMVTDTIEMADEEVYEDPQMPGAFEVTAPKPKPAPQPAQAQASRKRPASDEDQIGQRKRTKHGKDDLTIPAVDEEVTAVESWVAPAESKALARPRGTKRARSDVGSEFGDKLRVKKKGKKMEEIVDVEMGDQDEPQQQQQQLVVSNGARKSKRTSAVNGKRKKKPVQEDEEEDAMVSNDPLCQGRRIGSEWVIGDRRFKVGPDGKRLRLAPLRTTRKKYEMVRFSFSQLSVANWLFTLSMCSLLILCILTRQP